MTPRSFPDHRPHFPARASSYGIAVLGCGEIARTGHLPAYTAHGLDVVGVWSRSPRSTDEVRQRFGSIGTIYDTPEQLLADPRVKVVDLATRVEHRLTWLAAAIDAGKHVLAQKPLTDDPDALEPLLAKARTNQLRVAVNQNARWAPVWRAATLLIEQGAVGEVVGVTHLLDKRLPPLTGTHFDQIPHMLLTDYLLHWIDITRCWLAGKRATSVQACDGRVPGQPEDARNPWTATLQIGCDDGATALVRVVGDARTRTPSCPFWVHGTEGTLRGSILGQDFLEVERDDTTTRYHLEGAWFVDGFAGTMGELLSAIDGDREPSNSAQDNLATLRLVQASRRSADEDARPLAVEVSL